MKKREPAPSLYKSQHTKLAAKLPHKRYHRCDVRKQKMWVLFDFIQKERDDHESGGLKLSRTPMNLPTKTQVSKAPSTLPAFIPPTSTCTEQGSAHKMVLHSSSSKSEQTHSGIQFICLNHHSVRVLCVIFISLQFILSRVCDGV